MFLCKKIYFAFLILYELPLFINTQEFLNQLKPKEFKFNNDNGLPPVELPRPIISQKVSRALNDELADDFLQRTQRQTLMGIALEASVREGLNAMRHLYSEVEPNMVKNGQLLEENHPGALLSKFSAPAVETAKGEMAAYATLTATKVFRQSYNLSNDLARQAHGEKVSLRRTALESMCPAREAPTCMPASERYRTHDGTCNNKRRPRWGAAQMPFNRFLPPEYGDGVDTTRNSVDGGPLSSSRFVSLLVHGAREGEAPLTLMLTQWGQLLDHDLTSTAQPRSINGSVPSCCGSKNFHPSCFPIKVPLDDPWLSPLKVRCLEFLRSAPAQRRDCVLSWREQTNQATSYIDASPIYSSSVKSSDTARVFHKGLLIFGRGNPNDDLCQRGAIATHCIRSGDGRSGEQPGLLALHHVWVHEHNHIAMKLSELNLHWSDEKIYQETRRIIGAMFQHITYREFLPIVLGREVLKLFDLELLSSGYYEGYDPKINPTVANAFAAAAFRFGHSLVQNSYIRCDRFHNIISNNVSLHEEFQRGDIGSAGSLHRLLRGMATQRALKRDEFITPELTNHLFQTPGFPFGLDLAAINIQRGRDHGIAPYTHWRVPCGLSPLNSWEEFANIVGPESARRISHAYHSVHDIDLFVGGIAERPVIGGIVGPTLACIIAQQFSNSRKGDRFWYENSGFESSFTPAQLHSIRRVSLASVLCRAVGGGTFQPHIFLPARFPDNERLPCGAVPLNDFDIEPWLEQDPFTLLGLTHTAGHQPPVPTFEPQTQPSTTFKPHPLPDRIFDITQLEAKLPENTDTPLTGNKVGFSNRNPAITLITDSPTQVINNPDIDFVPHFSDSFLSTKNSSKINDKLDLKKMGKPGHVTKQKPIPGVNNKLDKNNHNGGGGHGVVQKSTRRTVIVNNVPIELRNAGRDKHKTVSTNTGNEPEPRTGNAEIVSNGKKTEYNNTKTADETLYSQAKKDDVKEQLKPKINNLKTQTETENIESKNIQVINTIQVKPERETDMKNQDDLYNTDNSTTIETMTDKLKSHQLKISLDKQQFLNKDKHQLELNNENKQNDVKDSTDSAIFFNKLSNQTEIGKKIIMITQSLQDSKLNNVTLLLPSSKDQYDSDIDPIAQATPTEHKRVQRKEIPSGNTDQLKDKCQLLSAKNETTRNNTRISVNNNRTLTTKFAKPSRKTVPTVELRQYQSRPSFTKTPPKVVMDSLNVGNQYEIEINIRQTHKSPKPVQTTPHIADYANRYNTNQIDRYTTGSQTTPLYSYYQPVPTQISPLTLNHGTKPPTIIFVNEHEQHTTTKLPGFLHSILGWNLGTKRPLPASIGFNERPGLESIIGSPHSTANVQPVYPKPPSQLALPVDTSSFSQAQVDTTGIVQASSASISSGDFGSIAGFASASGTDSTFSFNIRPKPDKSQNSRPIGSGGSYELEIPQRNPWYEQKPTIGQHISTYDLPYRENINSPFSTSNLDKYYIRNKTGPRRKEAITLTPAHEYADYEYTGRILQPLSNITSEEEIEDNEEDYEYDDDYGTSPLLTSFNQDGYLRPEHMIGTILETVVEKTNGGSPNLTAHNNQTLDDNYVLPLLNSTMGLPYALNKPLNINFSTDFSDTLGKHLNAGILAEDSNNKSRNNFTNNKDKDGGGMSQVKAIVLRERKRKRNKNRNKNNIRNRERIAFAPINILTKPERPDNWVFFDSPRQEEPSLPQTPELKMEPVPSAEIPKPLKQNSWLDLSKFKKKHALQFQRPSEHLKQQPDIEMQLKPDKDLNTETLTDSNKQASDLTEESVADSNKQDLFKATTQTD